MSDKHRVVFEVDRIELFDMLVKVGDGGQDLGVRIVGTMLGGQDFASAIGNAVYGVLLVSDEPARASTPARGEGA